MTNLENVGCDPAQWLARYAAEEAPPPEVDLLIRARLRSEAGKLTLGVRIAVAALAAAALLLILWALDPRSPSLRSERGGDWAALHAGQSARARVVIESALRPAPLPVARSTEVKQPEPESDPLEKARNLIREGNPSTARSLLEPCPEKIGTDALLEDCQALVIEAMCADGHRAEAHKQIDAFRKRWPGSFYLPELTIFCR